MNLKKIGALSLACVTGTLAFGIAANAALDLVFPAAGRSAAKVEAAAEAPAYALASTTSTPVVLAPAEIAPIKVKTVAVNLREETTTLAELADEPRPANVPLPRRRPASAPGGTMAMASTDISGSIARQPGTMAIAAATRKGQPEDGQVLGAAGIERMRVALALTDEQAEYWPAIASELQALGKVMKLHKGADGKIDVDNDTVQRLYWAAAPLLTRLSYEQKQKVKQMAHVMGLHQVAAAL